MSGNREVNQANIAEEISFLYQMAVKYPEDGDIQQKLTDAYAALGDPERAVKEWRRLTEEHPQSLQLERRLAAAYDNCDDPARAIRELLELLGKRPNNLEYQECLSRAYLRNGNASEAITGWTRLVNTHPTISLVNKLDEAYATIKDNDVAMEGWWAILEKHPTRLSVLRKLRDTCESRYQGTFSRMSVFRFALLCFLSFISRKFVYWDMGESDWRPLANEDDLMMVRPFMEKRQWYCVIS
jgi:tetratricopeptide (TPR) repeat protein